MARPILVIHGGAGAGRLTAARKAAYAESLRRILEETFPLLEKGAAALKAVVKACEFLEDDPLYNAGKGSKIQRDGHIRMSASLMDGKRRRFSGCVNVEGVKNPILLAAALQNEADRVLAGAGAREFARAHRLAFASPFTARAREQFEARQAGKTGTVGAVALDRKGRLAAATSTGGKGFEFPHRVSDSPTVAGNFADESCAVSATGIGEQITEFSLAASLCTRVACGETLAQASRQALLQARKARASFGWIAVDKHGHVAAEKTTPTLIWATVSESGIRIFD